MSAGPGMSAGPDQSASTPPARAAARGGEPRTRAMALLALGGRLGGAWERDRRDTLFLMGAVLLSVLPQFPYLPAWAGGAFMLLFFWRAGLLLSGRSLPADWIRWGAAVAAVGATWAHHRTVLGRDPGVLLLVLFLGLKLLEMRARRDLFVVIFLCCFLLITGYFHSQGPWMAAATLVALLMLVASMLTMQYRREEPPVGRRLRLALVLMLQALPLAVLLFVLFPRPASPLWSGERSGSGASTGLSDSMSPGDISDLASSDAVVMRVEFEGGAPPPNALYWRGPTLATFDGRGWRELPRRALASAPPVRMEQPRGGASFGYTVTLEPTSQPWLLAPDLPVQLPQLAGRRLALQPTLELVAQQVTADERIRYSGRSRLDAQVGLADGADADPDWMQRFLALPPDFNPRTRAQIAQMQTQATTPAALVDAVLAWFHDEPFRYTFKPQALGRDSVDDFLFRTREGFCEHYSSAFVVMMRMAGVPARVVTGYQGAEASGDGNYWIVRQADAHAWAEVWLQGRGWVRIDPTSAVAPERIERGARSLRDRSAQGSGALAQNWARRWQLGMDWLTHTWNGWILDYGSARQLALLSRMGLDFSNWQEVAGTLATLFAGLIAVFALSTVRRRAPVHPLEREFARFCERIAALGVVRMPHETPLTFLDRAVRLLDHEQSTQARHIVQTYNRLRYDLDTHARVHALQLRRLISAFRP